MSDDPSREANLAQTAALLRLFGVIKDPPKKKKAKALSGATQDPGSWHMAQGFPCRICGQVSNLRHLPYEDDDTSEEIKQMNARLVERLKLEFAMDRGIQLTFRWEEDKWTAE